MGEGLPSRGLETRLGSGRLLWVANTRICALKSHNGGRQHGTSLSPGRGKSEGRNIDPLSGFDPNQNVDGM